MISNCVYTFIFRECLGEAHEPCDCQTWKDWLQKVSEMKPEERKSHAGGGLLFFFFCCYFLVLEGLFGCIN